HTAWGGSLYMATDLYTGRVAVLPRYRRWLSEHTAADLAVGPVMLDTEASGANGLAGGMGRLSFDAWSMLSLTAQVDMLRRDSAWKGFGYAGIGVGSFVAIPASLMNVLVVSSLSTGYFSPELNHAVPPN